MTTPAPAPAQEKLALVEVGKFLDEICEDENLSIDRLRRQASRLRRYYPTKTAIDLLYNNSVTVRSSEERILIESDIAAEAICAVGDVTKRRGEVARIVQKAIHMCFR